ncbi:hypothetical protein [Pseudomonas lundensis]|uniref:hypothetical protein n=1 Tax=Pseudomonas lundensis TaxID=86185 RepID=UPI0012E893E4|nr:hypothetical protein [Pseudomonas lundensis]
MLHSVFAAAVRIRYRSPLTSLLDEPSFIGGAQGLTFTYSPSVGLIAVRDVPTPVLDKAMRFRLSAEENSEFLNPLSSRK